MKLLFLLFLSNLLLAQSHPHALTIRYLPAFQSLDWSTRAFDDKEKPSNEPLSFFDIHFPSATMSKGETRRKFGPEEAKTVSGHLNDLTKFIAEKIVGGDPAKIIQLEYDLSARKIHISVQESTLTIYTYHDGTLLDGEKQLKLLEPETNDILLDTSVKLIRYCVESTIWWLDGFGTPVDTKI